MTKFIQLPVELLEWLEKNTRKKCQYYELLLFLAKNANYAEGKYENGVVLRKGELWATKNHLSKMLGYTYKTIRVMLDNLKHAGFIEINHNFDERVIVKLKWLNEIEKNFLRADLDASKGQTSSKLGAELKQENDKENQQDIEQSKTDKGRPNQFKGQTSSEVRGNKKYKKNIEDNIYIVNSDELTAYFETFWKLYRKAMNKIKEDHGEEYTVNILDKKESLKVYSKLIEVKPPDEILTITRGYLIKKYSIPEKPKAPLRFLKVLKADYNSYKEEFYKVGLKGGSNGK